ncbi:MAG: BrnT family toxin [Acidobacteriota bacterium]
MRFEWDDEKADGKERDHNVTFIEAATVFDDDLAVALPDPDHSIDEARFLLLGESNQRRLLVVSYAERGEVIRLISARIPTRREQKNYENR